VSIITVKFGKRNRRLSLYNNPEAGSAVFCIIHYILIIAKYNVEMQV
jgi:hypothetical protein